MRRTTAALVRCILVLTLLLAAAGCDAPVRRVTIMVPWSGNEFQAFYAVIQKFENDRHVKVDVQVSRDLTQQLDAAVGANAPPDLAVLSSVAAVHFYAGKHLRALDIDTSSFVQPFRGLGMKGEKVYAVPVKADIKSLVWHGPGIAGPLPKGWSGFRDRPERWCLGLESGPTSGWPGADWIADILLADKQGVRKYKDWLSGDTKWKSLSVQNAWKTWRGLVEESLVGASKLPFLKATGGMMRPSPTCSLSHGALSAMAFEQDDVKAGRYRHVEPLQNALQVSADYIGKFTKDDDPNNASADQLISYLASEKAQQAWVDASTSYALSARKDVTDYANSNTQQELAEILRSDATLCFTAADAMDPDVSAAFYRAVLDYAQGDVKDPEELLNSLDNVQSKMGHSPQSLTAKLCATPT
ncbi:ABC transporter substrate-binding protein [Streptomyces sp. HNM0663]|uniref:ABC transporter substrate-binding protein n=1 Tax=Streptomyces chengmaiensis TaxID=3040919 RepID=A0ABT6HPE5_9ACTN|nr:ABC transporter substrate-binding protein [Streptomyces chengmaiensis]MDH2390596.1 ABC transporter substrate-binding protein [Streptomyces chengmaiensis]